MPNRESAAAPARPRGPEALTEDTPIQILATGIHGICGRLTTAQLEEIHRSVEHACLMPKHIEWDHRAATHAAIYGLLADAADDPVLAKMLNSNVGFAYHLMITAGPAAGNIVANSSKRLLTFLSAGDADEAARETEDHLRVLRFMGRLFSRAPLEAD